MLKQGSNLLLLSTLHMTPAGQLLFFTHSLGATANTHYLHPPNPNPNPNQWGRFDIVIVVALVALNYLWLDPASAPATQFEWKNTLSYLVLKLFSHPEHRIWKSSRSLGRNGVYKIVCLGIETRRKKCSNVYRFSRIPSL